MNEKENSSVETKKSYLERIPHETVVHRDQDRTCGISERIIQSFAENALRVRRLYFLCSLLWCGFIVWQLQRRSNHFVDRLVIGFGRVR